MLSLLTGLFSLSSGFILLSGFIDNETRSPNVTPSILCIGILSALSDASSLLTSSSNSRRHAISPARISLLISSFSISRRICSLTISRRIASSALIGIEVGYTLGDGIILENPPEHRVENKKNPYENNVIFQTATQMGMVEETQMRE